MKNLKKVKITIPNERVLNLVKNTPTFKQLTKLDLIVGDNVETVNHYQFSQQMRMFPIAGATIIEIK